MLRRLARFALVAAVLAASTAACSSTTVVEGGPGAGSSGSSGGSSGSSGGAADGGSEPPDDGGASGTDGSTNPATALQPGTRTLTIEAAGRTRSIIVVVPSSITTKKLPLVIALHGDGDTNQNFIQGTTNLEALAASDGFVLAAPQGITQNLVVQGQTLPPLDWDPYRTVGEGNIDLPLLDALKTQLVASTSLDEKHLVVFGYSQGGYLSFRYGIESSTTLACAAVMAAANPLGPQLTAGAARKIPFSLQVGTNDSAVAQARSTKTDLTAKGFPLDYHEIAGAGHVPVPGGVTVPLAYCLGQTLP